MFARGSLVSESVLFLANNTNLKMGSYRIWVNDLRSYFNQIGIHTAINEAPQVDKFNIIILDKNSTNHLSKLKAAFPRKKIGIINLARNSKLSPDFVIVGSIEEMDSLSHHKNVILFPLIENLFQNCKQKKHEKADVLKICYHGHNLHLNAFYLGLKGALEKFHEEVPINLQIITGDKNPTWIKGRPDVPITHVQYDLNTIVDNILKTDIGIVPNISAVEKTPPPIEGEGLFNTDYLIRFKNKSNAGRSFVFHQLGIPVVADLSPSHLHILGNPQNGFCVLSERGWLKAFRKLKDHQTRQKISDSAKDEFDRLYNPETWAKILYKNILEIQNER